MANDDKIEAVHNLLEHWTTANKHLLLLIWSALRRTSRKSREHEVLVNSDVVLNAFYSRTTDTLNRSSNDTMSYAVCF